MVDRIYDLAGPDVPMRNAIHHARQTLRDFFEAFNQPKSNQRSFLLKVRFESEGKNEHIWVADIDASISPIEGTIANEPELPGLTFMQRASFHPTQITDWMYIEDGYLVGGFTTMAIRAGLSHADRVEYDANAPFKFRD
jgi:uncharacterized protein YegJ (DUF2314 family)